MNTLLLLNIFLCGGLAVLVALIVYLGSSMSSKEHFLFIGVMAMVALILLGSILEYNATSLEAALSARKIAYLGSSFAEWFLLIFCIYFLGYRNPKIFTRLLLALHFFIFACSITLERNNLIYTSAKIEYYGNIARVSTTPGVVNIIQRFLMLFYIIIIPYICGKFWRSRKNTPMGRNALILGLCALVPGLGYIPMVLGLTSVIDVTSILFVLSVLLAYILIIKGHMFDVVDIARNGLIDNLDDGVIIVDTDMRVLYMNKIAADICPDIDSDTDYSMFISGLFTGVDEQYKHNEKTYNLRINPTTHKGKNTGFTLVFTDVTHLADYASRLESEVETKVTEITAIQKQVLISLANMIEIRDDTTGEHVKRTTEYVKLLATSLLDAGKFTEELTEEKVEHISEAAALHDIGKIAVSDAVLCKPGKLTLEEFEEIKVHTTSGGEILDQILRDVGDVPYLEEAKEMALYHHEKYNGAGYPEGRKGDDIPLSARIMAVADVFDALISKRQYKEAFSFDKAFSIIEESKGSHFDPEIVEVFVSIRPEIENIVQNNR